jgi:tetratricopeptide (TPR) repeat protein
MRLAILVAPSDPSAGDAGARRMALAWLRGRLARFGFQIVIVGGGAELEADLQRALDGVSPGDSVLLHLSGRLSGREAIALGDDAPGGSPPPLPLGSICERLAARVPGHVSLIAELTHDEDPTDPLAAAGCLETAVFALGARERGYLVLAAVRPTSASVERVAFTRLAFPPPTGGAVSLSDDALLAAMHERAVATPESYAVAQSFTFAVPHAQAAPLPAPTPTQTLTAMPTASGRGDAGRATPPDDSPATSLAALDDLIEEATQARQWGRALELRRRRLDAMEGSRHKVRELVAIARILQAELHDAESAIQALEVARAIDRSRLGVLQALRRGYESLGRWENAAEVIGTMAEVAGSSAERASLRYAQSRVALDQLGDEGRAIASLEAALEEDPTHAEAAAALTRLRSARGELDAAAREQIAERRFAEGDEGAALSELETAAALEPMRASLYARMFEAHRRAGRTDAALLAAMSLEELGEAEVDQQVLIGQFRQVTPVRARASFDAQAWQAVRAPGSDEVLGALFAAIESAAVATRIDELRRRRKLSKVDPAHRLSETSTASVARSFQWAARVLSIQCPDLYVADQVAGGIGAIQAAAPSTALGPEVLRGPSVKDLAFLAGRHLTYYRPEYHVLVYYPTREELTNLLLAAVQIAMPEPTSPSLGAPVRALHARMERRITPDEREALAEAVAQLDARGGRAALGAWIRSVELTAARVGLVLCGDLASAAAIVRSESRAVGGLPAEAKRGDLVAFGASRAHAALRVRFAATAPESLRPPPTASGVHVVL